MPASVAAYDLYLRARKLLREYRAESVLEAIALLEKALAEDPDYTAAMAALQTLRSLDADLSDTQGRVSSGLRVRSAADNAAYWSISTTMPAVPHQRHSTDSRSSASTVTSSTSRSPPTE